MAKSYYMDDNFESQKNIKASGYTFVICTLLFLAFLFIKWALPEIPEPPTEEGIEVNLGNSDLGSGDDQPFLPGQPSPADQAAYQPPKASFAQHTDVKDFETNDDDEEAPSIAKPVVKKTTSKVAVEEPKKVVRSTEPVTNPTPPPPKPKAVFKGVNGSGSGGNEADSYKKGGNQGVAGGSGDQGRPGGNPNSSNYEGAGGTGKSGVSISRGLQGRRMVGLPSFEDDFNQNAKIAVDIRVDENGRVSSATYQPRGSTTSDASMKAIAIRKALQIKFNTSGEESMGTLIFNFKLRN